MGSNGKTWNVNQIFTFIGVIIGFLSFIISEIAVVVTITTPELRNYFGLEKGKPNSVVSKKEPVETETTSGPFSARLHENQPQFIEAAKTSLSILFNEEYKIVTLIIAPDVEEEITLPTVGSGSQEFASSTGVFLVHVLNVDWNSRTVTVQVSRKSS